MFALDQYASSLALGAIALGLVLCVLPLLDRNDSRARAVVLLLSVLLAWRYMIWRFTSTIPEFDFEIGSLAAWAFATLEAVTVASSTLALLILTRTKDRSPEADRHGRWWQPGPPPRVDVYIATYNEELAVLERSMVGAKELDYPTVRVFLLDDSHRAEVAEACARLGIEYRTRPDNLHAKAGNINYTLLQRMKDTDAPDFIAVLDADFVPHRNFVTRTLTLFHDRSVGLVQTPQHFFNPDPIQHNLNISAGYPDEQRFFFDHVQPARDAWGIAFCCGTSSMVRTEALAAIGGVPTESVTEDFLLTLRLDEHGWRTVYLNEALTEGLAPEGLEEYIVQRGRWCLGMMQIVRKAYNPFGARLRLVQRLSVLDSLLYWTGTFAFRLASLVCPLLYWYFGIAVVHATVPDVLSYYLPYYIAVLSGLNWISRGLVIPLLNDVSQLLAAWPIARAAVMGLLTKRPQKFRVTAKGGERGRTVIRWPLLRPFAILWALTLGGLLIAFIDPARFSYDQVAGDGMLIVMVWTIYNVVLLLVATLACIERPRENRPQREFAEGAELIIDDRRLAGWISELGPEQVRVRGLTGLGLGAVGAIEIRGVGAVGATIMQETQDGYKLRLTPAPEQRRRIISKLHTHAAIPGTAHGNLALVVKQLARSLTMR
jgi:cellulose synthase/poly-beta-1,6-N-acetylglucosamine synthase-like glycosyltransferase